MTLMANHTFLRYCEIAKKAGETKVSSSINRMIAYNEPVRYIQVEGTWFDLDQPGDLLPVNNSLLKEETQYSAGTVFVPDGDTIEIGDRMTLAADIMVDPGVTLVGPLLISKSSRIASGSIIGPYVSISSESSIGEECSIKNCILLNSAEVPAHRTLEGVIVSGRDVIRG
jgi:NDP-sugar pyrophosphorylase family protein